MTEIKSDTCLICSGVHTMGTLLDNEPVRILKTDLLCKNHKKEIIEMAIKIKRRNK